MRQSSECRSPVIRRRNPQVTMASPIGRALLGKAVGEVAYLKLPTIVRQLKVVELKTIHDAGEEDI